jgi:hypothetical protein
VTEKLRRVVAIILGVALSSIGAPIPSTTLAGALPNVNVPRDDTSLKGQLLVNGSVTLNGKRAITGTTVLNDSRISVACAGGNSATVNLGKLGRLELAPGAQMVVRFSEGLISGELIAGKAIVNNATGVRVAITTPDGLSAADGKEAAALSVATQKGSRCTPLAQKGSNNSSNSSSLGAGAIAALLAGAGGVAAVAIAAAVSPRESASSPLP